MRIRRNAPCEGPGAPAGAVAVVGYSYRLRLEAARRRCGGAARPIRVVWALVSGSLAQREVIAQRKVTRFPVSPGLPSDPRSRRTRCQ